MVRARRRLRRVFIIQLPRWLAATGIAIALPGCGWMSPDSPPTLFEVQLKIAGRDVGGAIIDTGGGFEVLLKEPFGLAIVDSAQVLAFGGLQTVELTEPFSYSAGGLETTAPGAIVDASICRCNGLGFEFLRKTGLTLALDFATPTVEFLAGLPEGGVHLPFAKSPPGLTDFDAAFVDVTVESGGQRAVLRALLDTGATATVMRRGLIGAPPAFATGRQNVVISHPQLGGVSLAVSLYDTAELPDMILGTDAMRAWSDRWYFLFAATGGVIVVHPEAAATGDQAASSQ